MRILVFVLMIVLVPLRGWAGDMMATEMAANQVAHTHLQTEAAIESGASRARIHLPKATIEGKNSAFGIQNLAFDSKGSQTAAMHDCEGHAQASATVTADSDCDSCSTCQACHTLALTPPAGSLSQTFSPLTLPRPAAAHFASATTALGQKPPIS